MGNYPIYIKNKLMSIIDEMAQHPECYVKNPERDFTRNRKLNFKSVIEILLAIGGGSISKVLLKHFNYDSATASSSAFVQQRDKILPAAFETLLSKFINSLDNLKTYRCYESYNVFAHIEKKGFKYVFRVKDLNSNGIVPSLKSPDKDEFDTIVNLKLTRRQTNEIKTHPEIYKILNKKVTFDFFKQKDKEFFPISVRIVRFKISENIYETIMTNLDSSGFSTKDIKKLYHMRWGIETSFRELKYSLGLINFHSKKVEYIIQETFAKLVMYNFYEIITLQVVIKQKSTKQIPHLFCLLCSKINNLLKKIH